MKTIVIIAGVIGFVLITTLVIYFATKKKGKTKNSCDNSCPVGYDCQNGTCISPGGCDPKCSPGEICLNRTCQKVTGCHPPCKNGQKCIENICVTPTPGKCTPECKDGQVCHNGQCVTPEGCYPKCKDGNVCINHTCIDPNVCDPKCPTGYVCKHQVCVEAGGGGKCSEDTDCPPDKQRCVNPGQSNSYCTACESHFDCTEDNPVCLNPKQPNSTCIKCRNSADCVGSGVNLYDIRNNTSDFPGENLGDPMTGFTEETAKLHCDRLGDCSGFTMSGVYTQFKGSDWNPYGISDSKKTVDILAVKQEANVCTAQGTSKANCVACSVDADCQNGQKCDPKKNLCYDCLSNSDCTEPEKNICDNNTCVTSYCEKDGGVEDCLCKQQLIREKCTTFRGDFCQSIKDCGPSAVRFDKNYPVHPDYCFYLPDPWGIGYTNVQASDSDIHINIGGNNPPGKACTTHTGKKGTFKPLKIPGDSSCDPIHPVETICVPDGTENVCFGGTKIGNDFYGKYIPMSKTGLTC